MSINTIEGGLTVNNARFCVVVARWNSFVVDSLEAGAIDTPETPWRATRDITIVPARCLRGRWCWTRSRRKARLRRHRRARRSDPRTAAALRIRRR